VIGLTPLFVPLRFALQYDHLLGIPTAIKLPYASMSGIREKENKEINIHQSWLRKSHLKMHY